MLFLSGHPHSDLRLNGVPASGQQSENRVLGSAQIASADRFRIVRIDSRRILGRARTRTNGARGFDMSEQMVGEEHAQQAEETRAEQPTREEVGENEDSEDEEETGGDHREAAETLMASASCQ